MTLTTVAILNAVLAVLIVAGLLAVKLTAYHVTRRDHDEVLVPSYSEDERLAA